MTTHLAFFSTLHFPLPTALFRPDVVIHALDELRFGVVQGVALSETLAQGDLTGRLNLVQRDEVGMLAGAMDQVAAAFGKISVNVGTISSAAEATARNVTTVATALQESTQAFEAISHETLRPRGSPNPSIDRACPPRPAPPVWPKPVKQCSTSPIRLPRWPKAPTT